MRRTKLCVTKLVLLRKASHNASRIDYDETYSPVMDVITFRYLISLVVSEKLSMQLMDVVIAYLYGDLDMKIYMKVPEGLTLTGSNSFQTTEHALNLAEAFTLQFEAIHWKNVV